MLHMLLVLLIIFLIAVLFGILYFYGFRKPCYRVVEETYMKNNGKLNTNYIVQQYNSVFIFNWWLIQYSGDEYSSGSTFDNMEEANTYIESLIYNRKKHVSEHEPICADSVTKE
jgi:nitrogen fixation/metabolism regulation signal transduction histidine kinase